MASCLADPTAASHDASDVTRVITRITSRERGRKDVGKGSGCPSPATTFSSWLPAISSFGFSKAASTKTRPCGSPTCSPSQRRRSTSGWLRSGSTPTPGSWAATGCSGTAARGGSAAATCSSAARLHPSLAVPFVRSVPASQLAPAGPHP
jgi:hypothetical protein